MSIFGVILSIEMENVVQNSATDRMGGNLGFCPWPMPGLAVLVAVLNVEFGTG